MNNTARHYNTFPNFRNDNQKGYYNAMSAIVLHSRFTRSGDDTESGCNTLYHKHSVCGTGNDRNVSSYSVTATDIFIILANTIINILQTAVITRVLRGLSHTGSHIILHHITQMCTYTECPGFFKLCVQSHVALPQKKF